MNLLKSIALVITVFVTLAGIIFISTIASRLITGELTVVIEQINCKP